MPRRAPSATARSSISSPTRAPPYSPLPPSSSARAPRAPQPILTACWPGQAEFAPCWDNATGNWTVLSDVKIWFNEKGKQPAIPGCPLGCPTDLADGTFGDMSIGFGCGGHTSMADRVHIGPEYGFGFALHDAMKGEPTLIIKTACKTPHDTAAARGRSLLNIAAVLLRAGGGKTLCGDFLPPSSVNATNNKTVGFYCERTQRMHSARYCAHFSAVSLTSKGVGTRQADASVCGKRPGAGQPDQGLP